MLAGSGVGVLMHACSFSKLVQLLDKKLDLDRRLEVLNHLDLCDICREAVYHISRDRDQAFFTYYPSCNKEKVA
jgi:anti-sigma factor RsiW